MGYIMIIIALILMITTHEFGHFIAGKLLKVPVYEFAIGMGPAIWSKQGKKETKYSIRILPIGGFCSFDKGDATGIQDMELNKHPVWKRTIIFVAGATLNLLSALIISIFLCGFIGLPKTTTTIANIASENTDPFLEAGDTIVNVNGIDVENNFSLMTESLSLSNDDKAHIIVRRKGELLENDITLIKSGESYLLGINVTSQYIKSRGLSAISDGFKYFLANAVAIFISLWQLITGKVGLNQMSGIVGIVSIVGNATKQNIINLITYYIMLSANLGIFNLLPIPPLDGSKILFCGYESIFKKRVPQKFEETITLIFALIFILFMIFITILDIMKIF